MPGIGSTQVVKSDETGKLRLGANRIGMVQTFHAWQQNENYENEAGFCYSATLEEIEKHDFVLTPGRYVGAAKQEEDSEPFAEKMTRLTGQLKNQFKESDRLEGEFKKNLAGLGYEC